jgi:tape measure domain-containing protein
MTDRKDVELLIRATDQSKSTLQSVAGSVNSITDALKKQIDAASKGDGAIDQLKASLNDLKKAGDELIRQQGLIDTYQKQNDQLERLQQKANATASAFTLFKNELSSVENVTKTQQSALDRLEQSMNRAETAVAKQENTLAATTEKLAAAGIYTNELAQAQKLLLTNAQQVGVTMAAASESVSAYAANLRAAKEAAQQQAEVTALQVQAREAEAKATREAAEFEQQYQAMLKQQQGAQYVADLTKALEAREAAERAVAEATKQREAADAQATAASERAAKAEQEQAAAFERQHQAAKQMVQDAEYVKLFSETLDIADAQETALGMNKAFDEKAARDLAAFRKLADAATMAANGYKTFGQASDEAGGVGASLKAITDPAEAARSTLAGLEQQVNSLSQVAASTSGPVKQYSETVKQLQAAMKATVNTGEAIDAFRGQVAAVNAARAAFKQAQADVLKYSEAIKAADAPDQALAEGLKRAQSALQGAQRDMQKTVETARELQAALQAAGVATNQLDAEEARLATVARTATGALNQLNSAYREHGSAADASTKSIKLFGEGQRESLSLFQRLRGEVLGLAAAYIGIQGAIGLAGSALTAFVDKQAVENRLGVVLGGPDPKAIAAEYSYLHDQAERLGIGIKELADSYSKFALASKNANLNLDQTKYAFERITEAMRVNHSSTDAINGAFNQLEQMLSKNKVQMDDLRQASNWIPGLEGMLARGLGMVSVKQLFDGMQKGAIDAKTAILGLAQEMERTYAKQLPDSLKSLQAEQGRFTTSLNDFQRTIAESGFANAYISLLQKLNSFFEGAEGKNYARQLSDAFSGVVSVLKVLVDNAGLLQTAITAWVETKAISWAIGLVSGLQDMVKASAEAAAQQAALAAAQAEAGASATAAAASNDMNTAAMNASTTSAKALVTALGYVKGALFGIQAFVIGWDIGKALDDKFASVHKFSSLVVEEFAYAWDMVKLGFSTMVDGLISKAATLPARIGNAIKELAASTLDATAPEAAAQIRATKSNLDSASSSTNPDTLRQFQLIQQRHQQNMADIQKHGGFSNDGRALSSQEQDDALRAQQAADPRGYAMQKELLEDIKTGEKQVNDLIDERSKKLQDIIDKRKAGQIDEKTAEAQSKATFDSYGPKFKQLAADSMKAIKPMVDALGLKAPLKELQEYQSKLQGAVGVYEPNLGNEAKDKNANRRASMAESLQNELDSVLVRGMKGNTGTETFEQQLKTSADAVDLQYNRIIQKVKDFQKIGGSSINGKSTQSYLGDLEAAKEQVKQAEALKLELANIKKGEDDVNNVVKQRSDLYKDLEDRVKSGDLGGADAIAEANVQASKLNAQITDLVKKAIDFNNSMRGKPGVDNTKIDMANQQLSSIGRQAGSNAAGANRAFANNVVADEQKQVNDILKQRADLTQQYTNLVKVGAVTEDEAQKKIQADYADTNDALNKNIDDLQKAIDAAHSNGSLVGPEYDLAIAKVKEFRSQVEYINPDLVKLKDTFTQTFTGSVVQGADAFAETLAGLIDGTEKLSDSWKDFGRAIGNIFASFLKNIANAIISIQAMKIAQDVTNSTSEAGSFFSGLFTSVASAAVAHSGTVVGGSSGMVRSGVPASVWANAPRYHNGTNGPLGLRADEHAAILQKGEEVLSKDNPRNVLNGGGKASSAGGGSNGIRQVLAIGDTEIAKAMAGSAGEDTVMTHLKANITTVRQWVK